MAIAPWTLTWYALAVFFTDKSDLSYFEFKPNSPHFSLAQIEWKGIILNHNAMNDRAIVDLSHEDLTELLTNLFGNLTFIDLFQLWSCSQKHLQMKVAINWTQLFEKNKMHWSHRCHDLFNDLSKLNKDFLSWAQERKLSPQDLIPLLALKDFNVFNEISPHFKDRQLSRNDGKQAIDLLVDLILLNTPLEKLNIKTANWIEHLFSLRNPMTLKKDSQTISNESWPRYVQVQRQRTGDHLTHKMSITYSDDSDLKEKLERLYQRSTLQ